MRFTAPVEGRLTGVDVARGLALISMFVAHVAPSPGPAGVLNLSEFLTAALFALLIGLSAQLSAERMGFPMLFASSVVRAIAFIALGLWISSWGAQVDIILPYLGVLAVAVAVLAFLPSWALGLLAVVCWWFAPSVIGVVTQQHAQLLASGSYLHYLTGWFAAGENYRVFTMLVWASLGILAARLLIGRATGLLFLAAVIFTAAAGTTWWQAQRLMEFFPYTGNKWEVGFDALLALAALAWSLAAAAVLSSRSEALEFLAAPGRMTLSLYVLQVGFLALYSNLAPRYGLPAADDSWWMLALLIVVCVGCALLWKRVLAGTFARRGPLETGLALVSGRG